MKIFEKLGLKKYKNDNNNYEVNKKNAFVSFNENKNKRKDIVITLDKSIIEKLDWKISDENRVNIFVNGSDVCGLSFSKEGQYALSKSSINKYKIKMAWNDKLCKEPKVKGAFPIELNFCEENGNKVCWFKIPVEFYQ